MDWGLGHATRVVPVIRLLREAGAEVVLGADNKPLAFLRQQFPDAEWVRIPGYQPEYQKRGSLLLKMALSVPKMLVEAGKGHRLLEKIIEQKKIDAVISDNRYELWSEKVPTVFMTHQLNILLPDILASGRPIVRYMIYHFIRKHNELWIPDFQGEPNLSGKLSHVRKMPLANTFFIGPLSRFERDQDTQNPKPENRIDILCLLSGPEPQRTLFEKRLTEQLENSPFNSVLLSGKPDENRITKRGNLEIRSHAGDEEMRRLISSAGIIVCRSGYSSLMDLASLGTKAIVVPTPGQPEQEYLAKKMKEENLLYAVNQKDLLLEKDREAAQHYRGIHMRNDYRTLKNRIAVLLKNR